LLKIMKDLAKLEVEAQQASLFEEGQKETQRLD